MKLQRVFRVILSGNRSQLVCPASCATHTPVATGAGERWPLRSHLLRATCHGATTPLRHTTACAVVTQAPLPPKRAPNEPFHSYRDPLLLSRRHP